MTTEYRYPPEPLDAGARAAELEVLRARDLLGLDLSSAPRAERILARVLNQIESEEPGGADSRAVAGSGGAVFGVRRSKTSGLWVGVAAVAVLVVALVVIPWWSAPPAAAGPPSLVYQFGEPADAASAPVGADVLKQLSLAARTVPVTGSGDVGLVTSYGWVSPKDRGTTWMQPYRERVWVAADGSGVVEQDMGAAISFDGRLDERSPQAFDGLSRDEFPAGELSSPVPDLPADAADLAQALVARMAPENAQDDGRRARVLLNEVEALATFYVLPPELTAELWDMLADEPGIRTLGTTTDRLGRECIAITSAPFVGQAETDVSVLLVDPKTGRLVGTELVTLRSDLIDLDQPTVTMFRAITFAGLVEEIGASPS